MVAPTIVIVPGFWLGPRPYEPLVDAMKKAAPSLTDIVYAPLVSTGTRSPGAPNMLDDAMGIRAVIKPLVESGKRLVIVGHSSGAFLSAMATEDLEVGQKLAAPSGGGVERFVFVAGGLLPVGAPHPPTNWEAKDGETWVKDPDDKLFFDVDPAVAEKYCKPFIKSQPLIEDWSVECTYTGWEKAPSSYILTEHDRTISPQVQEMCSGLAKCEVIRIPTGHMPMLSEPTMLAEKILSCIKLDQ